VAGNGGPANVPGFLVDGYSAPTALAVIKSATGNASEALAAYGNGAYSHENLFFGNIPGSAGEMSKLAVLIGAFWLILTGVGSWRVMAGGVIGLLASAFLMKTLSGATTGPISLAPWEHLLCGGFLFGIVFMATDPVSCAATNTGKIIYGFLIGALTVLIRVANPAYPEGAMLAILFMNVMAPLIDHFVVQAHIKKRTAYARALNNA